MAAAGKGKRKCPKNRLPELLASGFVVSDTARKKQWILGHEIGSGGFGRVYLASEESSSEFDYVLKVEFHKNGPLFSEIHSYMSFGRPDQINEWVKKKKLRYLGVSPTYGFGSFEHNGTKFRFLVLQRYGTDLNTMLKQNGNVFSLKAAYTIAISVLHSLEYIHSQGYLHLDIKGANLLLGRKPGTETQVYLVDMGLSTKYTVNGEHRKEVPDPKKAHNGTIEYMSRDSHKGTPCTRRADFETLGYNLVYWLQGSLPWEGVTNCIKVHELKESFMSDVKKSLHSLFSDGNIPPGLVDFFQHVKGMKFEEVPNYDALRKIFEKAIISQGERCDGKLTFNEKKKDLHSAGTSSFKENVKDLKKAPAEVKKARVKRKCEKPSIILDPSIKPTPAMLDVLNKKN